MRQGRVLLEVDLEKVRTNLCGQGFGSMSPDGNGFLCLSFRVREKRDWGEARDRINRELNTQTIQVQDVKVHLNSYGLGLSRIDVYFEFPILEKILNRARFKEVHGNSYISLIVSALPNGQSAELAEKTALVWIGGIRLPICVRDFCIKSEPIN